MTMDGRSIDKMILPFLSRVGVRGIMMSYHYAKQMTRGQALSTGLDLFVDSGGFGLLVRGGRIEKRGQHWDLVSEEEGEEHRLSPEAVLEFQQGIAGIGATLDAPIPPGTDPDVAKVRLRMTVENAAWACEQKRRDGFLLYGAVQGRTVDDYRVCAREISSMRVDGLAIGGLVPRAKDRACVISIAEAVRAETDKPVHAFGMGLPELVSELGRVGVSSVDSSSPMRAAASGISWRTGGRIEDATPTERMRTALENIAEITGATVARRQGE